MDHILAEILESRLNVEARWLSPQTEDEDPAKLGTTLFVAGSFRVLEKTLPELARNLRSLYPSSPD